VEEVLEHDWFEDIDFKSIQDQSYISPIYDIATDVHTIIQLTSIDHEKGENTTFWNKKEKNAMK